MIGIVLAGGKGTRLGPLGAQLNKSLVSYGGRPMLVNHVLALRDAGCNDVVVVVSPDWQRQVQGVVERALTSVGVNVHVAVQDDPLGPVHAVLVGVEGADDVMKDDNDEVAIVMSDTTLDHDEMVTALRSEGSFVGVARPNTARNWCKLNDNFTYSDTKAYCDELVAVGFYKFDSLFEVEHIALMIINDRTLKVREKPCDCVDGPCDWKHWEPAGEVGMAPLLNELDAPPLELKTWHDIGDLKALAASRKGKIRSRSFNHLVLLKDGYVRKYGTNSEIEREIDYLHDSRVKLCPLFPRTRSSAVDPYSYDVEFVHAPTLAELFLYWPGDAAMWEHIADEVLTQVNDTLWRKVGRDDNCHGMTVSLGAGKLRDRVERWDNRIWRSPTLRVNGETYHAGPNLLYTMHELIRHEKWTDAVLPHGDLNFTNVLFSPGDDVVRLLDPRGNRVLDAAYDVAKFTYSYKGFAAISHGLYAYRRDGFDVELSVAPRVSDGVTQALDRVAYAAAGGRKVRLLEASLMIAGAPLHDGYEGEALYVRGVQLANEVIAS